MDKKQPEVIAETAEILAMFAVIVRSYKNLSSEDRQRVDAANPQTTKRFGFDGFDANHDPHGHAARDLVKLGGFEEIKDWVALNSRSQSSLLTYRSMLGTYHRLRRENKIQAGGNLKVEEINTVLAAPVATSANDNETRN